MKQCPRCKKVTPEHAKLCPYCGYNLETKYQPIMQKRNSTKTKMYLLVVVIFMFSPVLVNYFMLSNSSSQIMNSGEKITLGNLGDVENQREYIQYQYISLADFEESVEGLETQIKSIKNFEKELQDLSEQDIDKRYTIYVTDLNNVYYDLRYTIPLDGGDSISVVLFFDIAHYTNEALIKYYQRNKATFEEVQYIQEQYELQRNVISLVNDKANLGIVDKAGVAFNAKEESFALQPDTVGHYGIGITETKGKDICSIYVSGNVDMYTVRCVYQTTVSKDVFS